jgi:hypothetical protein
VTMDLLVFFKLDYMFFGYDALCFANLSNFSEKLASCG